MFNSQVPAKHEIRENFKVLKRLLPNKKGTRTIIAINFQKEGHPRFSSIQNTIIPT